MAIESKEVLFGQIAQAVVNWSMRAPKESIELKEFMPSHWGKTETTERRRMSPKRRKKVADELRERMKWIPGGLIVAEPACPESVVASS